MFLYLYIITKKSFKTKDIKYLYKNKNVYIFMHVKTKKLIKREFYTKR